MEKVGYRETLAHLTATFPNKGAISPREVAACLGCDIKTVYSAMARVRNPLPSVKVGAKKTIVPIPALARWLS
jgi:hypothetical protein